MIFLFLFSIISTSGCLEEEVKDSNNIDDSSDNYYNNPGDNSDNQNSDTQNFQNKIFGLETNSEELNAIDFKKGCYVGQENTARMKLKEKISRRIYPIEIIEGDIANDDVIKINNNEIGKIINNSKFSFLVGFQIPALWSETLSIARCIARQVAPTMLRLSISSIEACPKAPNKILFSTISIITE